MSEIENSSDVAALTVQLLSAYLANNTVPASDIAELIRTTRSALTGEAEVVAEVEVPVTYTPAVSVRKSLASPDYIISLIDGKPYKVLKRHLATHGLDAEAYRERYNLPASYPMVAPTFAAHRRAIAEKIGLGTKRGVTTAAEGEVVKKASRTKVRKSTAEEHLITEGAAVDSVKAKAPRKRQPKTTTVKAPAAKAKVATNSQGSAVSAEPAQKRLKLGLFGRS